MSSGEQPYAYLIMLPAVIAKIVTGLCGLSNSDLLKLRDAGLFAVSDSTLALTVLIYDLFKTSKMPIVLRVFANENFIVEGVEYTGSLLEEGSFKEMGEKEIWIREMLGDKFERLKIDFSKSLGRAIFMG